MSGSRPDCCRAVALLFAVLVLVAPAGARVISRAAEINLGREAASVVEREFRVDRDPASVQRVRNVGRRLLAALDSSPYPYEFHVVESSDVNAFALPGGFVYVHRGLLQLLPDDDALAFVLAHEITHVQRRHGIRQYEKGLAISVGLQAVLAGTGAPNGYASAAGLLNELLGLSFTRRDETEADFLGIQTQARAGYRPEGAARAMDLVRKATGSAGKSIPRLLRTHPAPDSRVTRLTQLASEMKAAIPGQETSPTVFIPTVSPMKPRALTGLSGKPAARSPFLPLSSGLTWTYRRVGASTEPPLRVRVLELLDAEPSGGFRVQIEVAPGVRTERIWFLDGPELRSSPANSSTGVVWRLEARLPLQATDTVPLEPIKSPLGSFRALRSEVPAANGAPPRIGWYAVGIGLVRWEDPQSGAAWELTQIEGLPKPENQTSAAGSSR